MRLIFHLSTNCTLRCTYCYQKHKDSKVLSFEDAKALLEDLFLYRKSNEGKIFKYFSKSKEFLTEEPIELDFFGGECTLHIDLIDNIVSYFEKLCELNNFLDWKDTFNITLETNGTTFFEPKVQAFIEKYKDRIDLPITIDGCKECHDACRKYPNGEGSYDDVEKAILEHKKMFFKMPNSKLTYCKENMKYIKASLKSAVNLGYKEIRASFDLVSKENQLDVIESEDYYECLIDAINYIIDNKIDLYWLITIKMQCLIDQNKFALATCGSDGTQIVINWDGNLYFCSQLSESFLGSKEKAQCFGNVHEGITKPEVVGLFKYRTYDKLKFNTWCRNCPLINVCEPCPARNILYFNDPLQYHFNCGAGLAEARACLYFAKRAKETDYPYFKDLVDKVLELYPDGELPQRDYALYNEPNYNS